MSTPTQEKVTNEPSRRRSLTVAVAAAATLLLAIAGAIALTGGTDDPPVADEPPLQLNAGEEDMTAMCIMFSPEELEKVAEIAFEGTVTGVDGNIVTLSVDHWFRGGGEATEVVLNAPQDMQALIGGIPFDVSRQYLVTAQDGNVNYCGFSGASTPDLRTAFEEAFGEG